MERIRHFEKVERDRILQQFGDHKEEDKKVRRLFAERDAIDQLRYGPPPAYIPKPKLIKLPSNDHVFREEPDLIDFHASRALKVLNQLGMGLGPGESNADIGAKMRQAINILNMPEIQSFEQLYSQPSKVLAELAEIIDQRLGRVPEAVATRKDVSPFFDDAGGFSESKDDAPPLATLQRLDSFTAKGLRDEIRERGIALPADARRKADLVLAIQRANLEDQQRANNES